MNRWPEWMRWRGAQRGLVTAFWFNAGLLLCGLVGMVVDHRAILGINAWIKPVKFDLSVMVYAATIAWMLAQLPRFRRLRTFVGWGIGVAMIFENGIISMQSLRGVRSHLNFATVFDSISFAVMGLLILLNTLLVAVLLGMYCARRLEMTTALAWGVRLGLVALLVGSAEGFYMVAGVKGHTVGAADGTPGLPFVNWSRSFGDLRVAHFFALHALQAMPLFGWWVGRAGWGKTAQVGAIGGFFVGYMALVGWLFERATAGVPVIGY